MKTDNVLDKSDKSSFGDLLDHGGVSHGGADLRAEREKAGVDIPTLSFELRIPKNYLIAIEEEDYDVLPGTTYGFGYIKSYCKFLNIDDAAFLDAYKMRTSMAHQSPHYSFPDEALEPRMSGAMSAMIVVLVLVTGYIGWQIFDRYQAPAANAPSVVATTTIEVEAPSDSTDGAVAGEELIAETVVSENTAAKESVADESVAENAPAVQDEGVTSLAQNEAQNDEAQNDEVAGEETTPTDDAQPAPTEESDAVQTAQLEEAAPAAVTEAETVEQSAQLSSSAQANERLPEEEIVISASSAAWVEIVSENGDVVLSQLFQAGEDYVTPADKKLYLSTGNAGGLVLNIPGLDPFQAGAVGEIIRDLPLSRESIRSRRSTVSQ